jgi:excisionase family DNA binding protein
MTQQVALLTVSQVAAVLNVHPATVRRWIASGALPATRLPGGTYRVDATDLDRIVSAA